MDPSKEVSLDVFPYLKVYKDGSVERLAGTEIAPPGYDPETGVLSKDTVLMHNKTGVSARLYLPHSRDTQPNCQKLPLVIYYHGGGFFLSSAADPNYHISLNHMVAEANVILVSVDYRLAPENPLPAAYEDSWDALEWVAAHFSEGGGGGSGQEAWLKDHVDSGRVYLAGDSCGASMAHHFGLRLKDSELGKVLKVQGIAMIHPYFWGKQPIGVEVTDPFRRSMVDNWWLFVCPSDKGCDDPLINPFTDDSPSLKGLACKRIIVIVAEKDILRDRGKLYYEKLVSSGWEGTAEVMEIKEEDHVFHILHPSGENARTMFKRLASFFNHNN